jgi:hypothetical protein
MIIPESFRSIVELDLRDGGYRTLIDELADETLNPVRYEVAGDGLYWLEAEPMVRRLNLKTHRRDDFPLSLSLSYNTHLRSVGARLFVVSPEYIAELDTKTGTVHLLASSRRRPAANALDSWAWRGIPELHARGDQALTAVFAGGNSVSSWRFNAQDGSWTQILDFTGKGTRSFHDGHYLFFAPQFSVCLDQVADADGSIETLLTDDDTALPRWQIPFNFPTPADPGFAHAMQHVYDGTNLWVLAPPTDLVPDTRMVRRVPLTDRHNTLLWFSPESEMPAEIPLWFEARPPFCPPDAKYAGGTPSLVPTRRGILFVFKGSFSSADIASVWFLDWTDLDSWRSRHQPHSAEIARRAPEMRRRFDQDGDGKLDATELSRMKSDAEWQKENTERDARRLLLTFDTDMDGRLSGSEMQRLAGAKFQVALPTEQQRMLTSNNRHIEPAFYDKNQDQSLDLPELLALVESVNTPRARPRPGPPGMRPFGPPGFPGRPLPPMAQTNSPTTMKSQQDNRPTSIPSQ